MSVEERTTDVLKAIRTIKANEDPCTLCSSTLIASQIGMDLDDVHETLNFLVDENLIEAPNKLLSDDIVQDWHVDRLTDSGEKWLQDLTEEETEEKEETSEESEDLKEEQ